MKRLLAIVWTWSWLPAALLLLWFVPWCHGVLRHFSNFRIHRNIEPLGIRLGELAHTTLHADLRRLRLHCGEIVWGTGADAPLRTIHLTVGERGLGKLDADLPYSGRIRVPGVVATGGAVMPADVRYRGDTYVHWGRPKKSFRIRLDGNARLDGMRVFNLSAPKYAEQINNHLSYRLAARLGLLSPRSELVELILDGRRHGLYELVEQPGAELVTASGRTAGSLCIGELLGRDAWFGIPRELFTTAGLWGIDDLARTPLPGVEERLADLLAALQAPASEDSVAAMAKQIDIEQFARFSVFEQITQTHHFDHFHNWRLHWDPERRCFEPLVWDPVGWLENMRPHGTAPIDLHPVFTSLHARLHVNAAFLVARDRCLAEFFDSGGDRELIAEVEHAIAATQEVIAADPNLWPPDPAAVFAAQEAFAAAVRHNLRELREVWCRHPPDVAWCATEAAGDPVRLRVDGPRPAAGLQLRFAVDISPTRVELRVLRADGRSETVNLEGHWKVMHQRLLVGASLPAALTPVFAWREDSDPLRNHRLVATPTQYDLLVHGVDMRLLLEVRTGASEGAICARVASLPPIPTRELFALASVCR